MKVDKQNGNVCYNDEKHIYWNEKDNGKYISVTTLIGKYEQPYDKEFWSAYKALEKLLSPEAWKIEKPKLLDTYKFDKSVLDMYDISENDFNEAQQDILDEWDKTNRESCERGTAIHSKMENMMYKNGGNITFKKLHINGTFDCEKDRVSLDLQNGVYPEYLLHYESPDGLVRIAGQTDLLIKNGNDIYIGDYKTNKKIEIKSFYDKKLRRTKRMKYPLTDLDDVNFWHYTMQLSMYAWMVQQMNPEFEIKKLYLIHYDHNNKQTIYECDYLKDKIEALISHYGKNVKHEQELSKYERIEY